jgi:splicing factor 3B subunit 2
MRILRRFNGEDVGGPDERAADRATAGPNESGPTAGDAPGADASGDKAPKKSDKQDKENKTLSKKELKRLKRMKIGELKQLCPRPEVVESWDSTALDPVLLVHLKAYRNSVPVPRHWSQKRRYLQGKKGIEKPPFQLPAFIAATGIGEMRQAYEDNAEQESLRSQGKARTRPKMNRMDIDYRVLYDAFFKHQEKPPLTNPGELYYEGKEYELANRDHFKPGILSDALLEALGMERGAPPPWLVSMQRYGPPPSYPSLSIPGLNAPIPPGAQFGYHPGGWGKPPVDDYGNPIYGDVFDQQQWGEEEDGYAGRERVYWGEVEAVESEEEEEEESEEESEEEESDEGEEEEEEVPEPTKLPSSTMEQVQLRKDSVKDSKQLYQVLEQKATSALKSGVMGSEHVYDLGTLDDAKKATAKKKVTGAAAKRLEALKKTMPDIMDVAIDPSDLENLDDDAIKELYEAKLGEARKSRGLTDLSDMMASHQAKRKSEGKPKKGEKKFKF